MSETVTRQWRLGDPDLFQIAQTTQMAEAVVRNSRPEEINLLQRRETGDMLQNCVRRSAWQIDRCDIPKRFRAPTAENSSDHVVQPDRTVDSFLI